MPPASPSWRRWTRVPVPDFPFMMSPAEYETLLQELTERLAAVLPASPAAEAAACRDCGGRCRGTCARSQELIALGACRLSTCPPMPVLAEGVAAFIDHTLLKPEATRAQVVQLCAEARQYGFASVCVNPAWIGLVAAELRGTPVRVCSVVGFPLGATLAGVKRIEACEVLRLGADEIDMVIHVGALKGGEDTLVFEDIRGVVEPAHDACARVKVIIETALLTDDEKIRACRLSQRAGADFVKTSTGFGPGGATPHDVALMRSVVGDCMGVKASGGVRSYEDLRAMVQAGASRVGASASVRILEQAAS